MTEVRRARRVHPSPGLQYVRHIACTGANAWRDQARNMRLKHPPPASVTASPQVMQGLPVGGLRRIILTASGGAFRDWPVEKLKEVGSGVVSNLAVNQTIKVYWGDDWKCSRHGAWRLARGEAQGGGYRGS